MSHGRESIPLCALVGTLIALAACNEPQAPVSMPPDVTASPLERIAGLFDDPFVLPLAEAVADPVAVTEVATALAQVTGHASAGTLEAATRALAGFRAQLGAAPGQRRGRLTQGADGEDEAASEETILTDALCLVVDDALTTLVQQTAGSGN